MDSLPYVYRPTHRHHFLDMSTTTEFPLSVAPGVCFSVPSFRGPYFRIIVGCPQSESDLIILLRQAPPSGQFFVRICRITSRARVDFYAFVYTIAPICIAAGFFERDRMSSLFANLGAARLSATAAHYSNLILATELPKRGSWLVKHGGRCPQYVSQILLRGADIFQGQGASQVANPAPAQACSAPRSASREQNSSVRSKTSPNPR